MGAHTTTSGPLFNGTAERLAQSMAAEMERAVAEEGARLVRANLDQSLQNPTGNYESHVAASPEGGDWEVTDGGVVYGPWLEGVGSRNFPKTRFRGYSSFRRAAQALDDRIPGVTRSIVIRYVRGMG